MKKPKARQQRRAPLLRNPARMIAAPVARAARGRVNSAANISGNPYALGGKLVIRHREYIDEFAFGAALVPYYGQVNPGFALAATDQMRFPWLSGLAQNFQYYRFRKLRFELCSEQATTAAGSVFMAFQENVNLGLPSSKATMMSLKGAVREPPWAQMAFDVPSEALAQFGKRYVASGLPSNDGGKDNTYTVGRLLIGNTGTAALVTATASNEIYASYEVELWDPISPRDAVSVPEPVPPPPTPSFAGATLSSVGLNNEPATLFQDPNRVTTGSPQVIFDPVVPTITFALPGSYLVIIYVQSTDLASCNPFIDDASTANVIYTVITTAADYAMLVFSAVTSAVNQTMVMDVSVGNIGAWGSTPMGNVNVSVSLVATTRLDDELKVAERPIDAYHITNASVTDTDIQSGAVEEFSPNSNIVLTGPAQITIARQGTYLCEFGWTADSGLGTNTVSGGTEVAHGFDGVSPQVGTFTFLLDASTVDAVFDFDFTFGANAVDFDMYITPLYYAAVV